ncbi:phosphatidylserine decarboxylase [Vallitalea okinawensis]|uniref:phosphatidylserine decarboxylase n=1 Tax=Vallitalea okinawensis TaxID=2078660 RepID=UPI000CFE26F5|nr:phosphatidylserine decarboxylase [Vallitalea okinawensis]
MKKDVDGKILKYLYSNFITRNLLTAIMRKNVLKIAQKYADSRLSTIHINTFAKKRGVKVERNYNSFNDFFARGDDFVHLKSKNTSFCSPCEGNVTVINNIRNISTDVEIKGESFTAKKLLNSGSDKFDDGLAYVFRLTTSHCHRLYSFDDMVIKSEKIIEGGYHSTHSVVSKFWENTLCTNYRSVYTADTKNFGQVAIVQIGSMLVSSINKHIKVNEQIKKGDVISSFKLGGSAVVILFEKGVIRPKDNLLDNITYVSIGENIGDDISLEEKKCL